MSGVPNIPPAPVGQQEPPARAAAFDSGSLRSARGPLLLATGTAHAQTKKLAFHCRKLDTEALRVNP